MNVSWLDIGMLIGVHLPNQLSLIAQAPTTYAGPDWLSFLQGFGLGSLGPVVINLIGAIAILLIGWIIAALVSSGFRGLLKRTDLDNRLAGLITGHTAENNNVENIAAAIIFWIVLILAVVAALNVLNLTTVSQPLNNFLNQIFAYLPKLGAAAIIVAIAWVVATLARAIAIRAAQSLSLDARLTPPDETTGRTPFTEPDSG